MILLKETLEDLEDVKHILGISKFLQVPWELHFMVYFFKSNIPSTFWNSVASYGPIGLKYQQGEVESSASCHSRAL